MTSDLVSDPPRSGKDPPHTQRLILKVDPVLKTNGVLIVSGYSRPETFLEAWDWEKQLPIRKPGPQSFQLRVPASDQLALTVIQDLNRDGKLNRNGLGIPEEPFGFSGNPPIEFSPPNFRSCLVPTDRPIHVKLHH